MIQNANNAIQENDYDDGDQYDGEPGIPEGIEPAHESIDLPIQTSISITVGEGLKPKPIRSNNVAAEEERTRPADQREELIVDSEDLPDDDDEDDDEYELDQEDESNALIEDS